MGEIDDAARRRRGRSFDERMLAAIGELDSWPLSYKLIASVAIVLAGLALRLLVLSPLGPRLAYITFFPMVIVATVAFGTYAAVLTTLLSVALAHAFVSPLRDSWDWLGAGLFVVGNVFVALLAGLLHRARDRLKTAGLERERDQALRQFVEQTPVAIAMFDRQMRYLAASRRWISDYGLAEPIIGRSHYEVFPEIPEAWKQVHRRGIAGELVRNDEDAFERADGSIQYLRWEVRPWRAGAGDIGGILIFTEDITSWKQSTEKTIESAARLEALVDTATEAIVVIDVGGVIQSANIATEEMFGFPAAELAGRNVSLLMPADTARAHDGYLGHFLRTGVMNINRLGREVRGQRKDGSTFPLDLSVAKWRDAKGAQYFTGIMRDISARKRAEAALRERDEQLRQAVDLAKMTYYRVDFVADRVTLASNFAEIMGFAPSREGGDSDSLTHAGFLEVLRSHLGPGDPPLFQDDLANAASETVAKAEQRFLGDDGRERWVECVWTVEHDLDGRPAQAFAVKIDITERRRAAEELARIRRMQVVGQLAGGIAHDFNNLLAVISGNLGFVEQKIDDEKVLNAIRKAQDAVLAGANFNQRVRRMLSLARSQPRQPELIALDKQIVETAELLRDALGRSIEIDAASDPDLWPTFADPGEIDSALFNLALNARDSMPGDGRLHIRARNATLADDAVDIDPSARPGDYVVISVADDGAGMTPEVRRRATEPFFTTKGSRNGTGLGLSGVADFARESGGFVSIRSAPGAGTIVSIYLPRAGSAAIKAPSPDDQRELVCGNGEYILVVEDDDQLREITMQRLEGLGYAVAEARTAAEAIQRLNSDCPVALVFSDIVMPGAMTGHDLARWVRAHKPWIKILMTTGYNPGDERRDEGGAPLGTETLAKPYSLAKLSLAIRDALETAVDQAGVTSPVNT